jgi:hypothetical protein
VKQFNKYIGDKNASISRVEAWLLRLRSRSWNEVGARWTGGDRPDTLRAVTPAREGLNAPG